MWMGSPYDSKSIAEIIDDYVLVRDDLWDPNARAQLVAIIEKRIAAGAADENYAAHLQRRYLEA